MPDAIDVALIKKKIAAYEQQAEVMLANFHRLKGAAIALKELLDSGEVEEQPAERNNSVGVLPLGGMG